MKFSENWLREIVNPPISSAELVAQLTMAGLEVESITPVADFAALDKVVVGEIVSCEKHPDADKLKVTKVNIGETEPLQIVCGATNVHTGMKVPTALIGANLPGGFKIKAAKLRGVDSSGMLCSDKELGLSEDAAGIMELPADSMLGQNIVDALQLVDNVIEVDLTPNRGDCLSIRGLAREVALINRLDMVVPSPINITQESISKIKVNVANPESCPIYYARIIEGIRADAATPLWMQEKLRRSGIRSISAVVDITNFIMLDLGQPMHAFDLAKIDNEITVRKAKNGENLTTLDGVELKLDEDTLVIADKKRALALAGVMGGQYASMSESSDSLVLECAYFTADALSGVARKYGLHTDSSHRFERGVDTNLQELAINRATELILDICGGKAGELVSHNSFGAVANNIELKPSNIQRILGVKIPETEVEDILTRLGLVISKGKDAWQIKPASWRFDIRCEADIIEELARIYGYDNLPATPLALSMHLEMPPEEIRTVDDIKQYMVARDYFEAINYSFVSTDILEKMELDAGMIALQNPLSPELGVMRTSLLPSLVQALQYNLNRQQKRIRLFETGLKFKQEAEHILQTSSLAGIVCGDKHTENWHEKSVRADFYDVKQDLAALLLDSTTFVPSSKDLFHTGQSADIIQYGEFIGSIGQIHPNLAHKLDIPDYTILFELELAAIQHKPLAAFRPLSKFPMIRRDLAFFVDNAILSQDICNSIWQQDIANLYDINVFDIYRSADNKNTEYSMALALHLQHPERTMEDEDVDQVLSQVINTLKSQFNIKLRD